MLFQRREAPNTIEKARVMLWPRRSFTRSGKYFIKRILRLSGSPHAIAAGVAAGVFASITPFVGLHFLLAFCIAFFIGGNFLAAAFGTVFGNPLSFPFIWASTFQLGSFILGVPAKAPDISVISNGPASYTTTGFLDYFNKILLLIKPMLIGALPMGAVCAVCAYFIVRACLSVYQTSRREKLATQARMRDKDTTQETHEASQEDH